MIAITPTGTPIFHIPKPGPPTSGVAARPTKPAPTLTQGRHPEAIYWLETNIGIAFEHVGRLQHLRDHYGDQLRIVQDVHSEWEHKADRDYIQPSQYAHSDIRKQYARNTKICKICKRLVVNAPRVLGQPWPLDASEAEEVRRLREHLAALPESEPVPAHNDIWTHRGECATIRAAQLHEREQVAAGHDRPIQVLGTNDGKAAKLAQNNGLADRTSAGILREMVVENFANLTPERAWELHEQMLEVAGMPHHRRPTSPVYFAAS